MSSLFFLPPDIILPDNSCAQGYARLFNHISNAFKTSDSSPPPMLFFGIYEFMLDHWSLVKVCSIPAFQSLFLDRSTLALSANNPVAIVSSLKASFEPIVSQLPRPISLRTDKTPIAERASIGYRVNCSSSVYQGEYPYRMTQLASSSFLSYSHFQNSSEAYNYLILINISPTDGDDSHTLRFLNSTTFEVFHQISVCRNTFAAIDLNSLPLDLRCPAIITCSSLAFIPLSLTISKDHNIISLEHTHPPSELFWGYSKFKLASHLKKRYN